MKTRKRTPRIEALEDRNMMNATPLSVLVPEATAGMLLPAVQKVREAANRSTADTSHKETIEIESWSLGASNPSAIIVRRWEKLSVPMTDEASHALYQDITIPAVEASGMSAGKVSYSDLSLLSLAPAAEPVTIKVEMKDLLISSARDNGPDATGETWVVQDAVLVGVGGAVQGNAVKAGYDVSANKKI